MRVLIAGATGVIGRRLLPLLRARGHHVTAMVREPARAPSADLTVVADALDRDAVRAALLVARPDVIVHQLSALRDRGSLGFEVTARLRTEGTANLLTAARDAGVRRIVAQSIAFGTAPEGDPVLNEDAPLYLDAPDEDWARTVQAIAELERLVLGTKDISGVALRYGTLYGPGTWYGRDGATATAVAAGKLRMPDIAGGITSFVHADDAAQAAVLAVESDATGTFNITDDDPAEASVWLPHFAEQLGGPPPRAVPADLAGRLLGWFTAYQLTEMRGASNDRARLSLDWKPGRPSWRDGMADDER
ncbi:NAD-dependent epimerase/dehydratase family protein [Amycolatopsis sp. NPDC059657]|uniref:NAD-dependent epimerase/dehydratase family protein n=1 Tax=Amycolatopsis sp. NPDC059657 TaxID=3346899 RepID=UPI00366F6DD6